MHWLATTPEQTESLGGALARALVAMRGSIDREQKRDAHARVAYLTGELGAGKTTLARGFIRALGIVGLVRSPSYAVLETYDAGDCEVVHLDAYRLQTADEAVSLGLREHDHAGAVWLVEWPERALGYLPDADLTITLAVKEEGRSIGIVASSDVGRAWLEHLEPVDIATAWI